MTTVWCAVISVATEWANANLYLGAGACRLVSVKPFHGVVP